MDEYPEGTTFTIKEIPDGEPFTTYDLACGFVDVLASYTHKVYTIVVHWPEPITTIAELDDAVERVQESVSNQHQHQFDNPTTDNRPRKCKVPGCPVVREGRWVYEG